MFVGILLFSFASNCDLLAPIKILPKRLHFKDFLGITIPTFCAAMMIYSCRVLNPNEDVAKLTRCY